MRFLFIPTCCFFIPNKNERGEKNETSFPYSQIEPKVQSFSPASFSLFYPLSFCLSFSLSLCFPADKCYLHERGSVMNAWSEAPGCSQAETKCLQIGIQQHYLSALLDSALRSRKERGRRVRCYVGQPEMLGIRGGKRNGEEKMISGQPCTRGSYCCYIIAPGRTNIQYSKMKVMMKCTPVRVYHNLSSTYVIISCAPNHSTRRTALSRYVVSTTTQQTPS